MHFSQISVSDLILVNEDGDVVIGDEPVRNPFLPEGPGSLSSPSPLGPSGLACSFLVHLSPERTSTYPVYSVLPAHSSVYHWEVNRHWF